MKKLFGKIDGKTKEGSKRRSGGSTIDVVARQHPVMSIEYTIDIQLTELGYPDILQTSVRETPCRSTSTDDSFPPSHTPTSLSTTQVQRLLVRGQHSVAGKEAGAAKQTPNVKQTTAVSPSPLSESCTPRNPTQDLQDGQAIKGAATPEESEPTVAHPQLKTEQGGDGTEGVDGRDASQVASTEMQDAADDSDDSEVSEYYEEEEIDEEEEEDEDEVNNESSNSGDYCCGVCDLQLASKFKLQDHMNLHTGARPYCCAECGKRFCQIYNYRIHLRTHAQTKVDPLQCRVCRVGFASQDDLKVHLSTTHFENQFYECDLCKHVFTSLKECESHVQLHKWRLDVTCEICGRNFATPKSLARHRRVTCHRSFKCTDCTKTFPKKNALLKHSFSHLGLLPYTCIRCRCHFRLAKLYRKHKCEPERIHCVACLREFLSQQDFQQHKKDTGCWGNQEPKGDEIRCLECGQRFETTEELKKHAGAHQRVLKCAECGKGFRSALLLMSHMGGHAGNSPCLCQSCGLGFPHQQNYDSHLKTCGQTPQPASAPKKRQTSKSSSSETKKVDVKPDSSNPTKAAAVPAAAVVNSSAAPVKGSPSSPGPATGGVSPGSGPSDGLWKLTLNSQPPPGVKLVVFLPVCASQTDGLTHTPAISPTLPVPDMQGQLQNTPLPLSNEHLGVNAALGAPANGPLNLVSGVKRHREWEAPLDLSHKCDSSKSPLSNTPPIKRELGECEVSGKVNSSEQGECKNGYSKTVVKINPGETATFPEGKRFKVDPLDLSSFNVDATSSGLIIDIKSEPPSPGPVCEPLSSTSCRLTEKEIKMEVDISHPTEEK